MLLIVAAALVWSRPGGRSGETEPDWNHLRLDPETMILGTLSSVENGYAVFLQEVQGKEDTQRVHLYRLSNRHRRLSIRCLKFRMPMRLISMTCR